MEKPKFRSVYINFGCKRDLSKSEFHQSKDIKKRWFVYYEFLLSSGIYKSFKAYGGINRFHTIESRYAESQKLRMGIEDLLEAGFNPLSNIIESQVQGGNDPAELIRQMPIIDGLKWACEKHIAELQPSSIKGYNSILPYVYKAIIKLNYSSLTVSTFKKAHLRMVMEKIQATEKISNNRYNAYMETIKGLYKEFVKFDVFEVSPLTSFEKMKEPEAKSYETLTTGEKKQLFDHLAKVHPDYLTYLLLMYHTALRPKELVSLQVFNYSEDEECFKIKPDETVQIKNVTHSKTKTQKTRYVAIPPEAMELIRKLNLSQYPSDYFIFSKDFRPGSINIDRKRATEIWAKEVQGVLKIDKKMYGLKHLGMDDKLDQGTSLAAIQSQAGHTTPKMTEKYTQRLKKIRQQEIKDNSKGFLEE